jgi:hypothetical protein
MLTSETKRMWLDGWRFGVAFVDCVGLWRRSEVEKELAYIARGGWTGWQADWQAGYVAALASAVGTDAA